MPTPKPWLLILILLTACTSKPSTNSALPTEEVEGESETISYEGQVPFDISRYLHFEIQLSPSGDQGGSYTAVESIFDNDIVIDRENFHGFYNVYPVDNGGWLLMLENSTRARPLRRTYINSKEKILEENFRNEDLRFQMTGNHLILLDNDNPVSLTPRDFLYRRTTPVFTVEGYFMYKGDTSYFYERNTNIRWPLVKLGSYFQAARDHNTLADKKNDTTYLKATAYCIAAGVERPGRNINVLVLKKILQSSTH